MTISASGADRPNAPITSPVPLGCASSANHIKDGLRSGKSSAPDGPWKASTRTEIIGPYRNTTNSAKNAASA